MTKLNSSFLYKLHKTAEFWIFEKEDSPILDNVIFCKESKKKQTNPTPKPITALQIIQIIILKINQESKYQVRPISFFFLLFKSPWKIV